MAATDLQWLESNGLRIAASVETTDTGEHDLYNPFTALVHVQQGRIAIHRGARLDMVEAGSFALVRKYTEGRYFKTWREDEGSFRMMAFLVQDDFLREVLSGLPLPTVPPSSEKAVSTLQATPALIGLMASLNAHFAGKREMEPGLVRLKTMEAITSVASADPDAIHLFQAYSRPERADLQVFMEHNYLNKRPLEELAALSGRSLSTFNRDFRQAFGTSPGRWLQRRRLERARELMLRTGRTASEIYLESGFEDLSHFSRSFKQAFGANPSTLVPRS